MKKNIQLDPSKLYGFKLASGFKMTPAMLGKPGKVPTIVQALSPKIGKGGR